MCYKCLIGEINQIRDSRCVSRWSVHQGRCLVLAWFVAQSFVFSSIIECFIDFYVWCHSINYKMSASIFWIHNEFPNFVSYLSHVQTSWPSLTSVTCSLYMQAITVTRHSFFPSSKISLIFLATSLRCSSSGRLTSDLTSPLWSKSSREQSSIFKRVYSTLLTIGASTISPAW